MNTNPFKPGSTHAVAFHVYLDESPRYVDGALSEGPRLIVFPGDKVAGLVPGLTYVGPCEAPFTVPEDFDHMAEKVAALHEERARIVSEYEGKLDKIDTHIANARALPAPAMNKEGAPA